MLRPMVYPPSPTSASASASASADTTAASASSDDLCLHQYVKCCYVHTVYRTIDRTQTIHSLDAIFS